MKVINYMTNNEIFSRLLFLTDLTRYDDKLIDIFYSQGVVVTSSRIRRWRRDPDKKGGQLMPDDMLKLFMDFLATQKTNNHNLFVLELPSR